MTKLELFHTLHSPQVREVEREDGVKCKRFSGYAVVFGQPSVIMIDDKSGRFFREYIAPEAITQEFIDKQDIVCTRQHDDNYIIARHLPGGGGSMTCTVDEIGVLCEFEFADSPMGRDCSAQVERGDLQGMSFTFYDNGYTYEDKKGDDGIIERTITSFDVITEVCIAAHPAYPGTTSACREALMREMNKDQEDREADERAEQARHDAWMRQVERMGREIDLIEFL